MLWFLTFGLHSVMLSLLPENVNCLFIGDYDDLAVGKDGYAFLEID